MTTTQESRSVETESRPSEPAGPVYFDMLAEMGLTKHLGGQLATDRLIEACRIGPESHVLDVGCGVGATPVNLAKQLGCRVIGIDLHAGMIERSRELAARKNVAHLTEFKLADVQDLPFEDETFDAVIAESVIAFAADKAKATRECRRVLKSGGYLGFNEGTWLTPPPQDLLKELLTAYSSQGELLSADAWEALLLEAGLREVTADLRPVSMREESRGRIQRYGWGGIARVWGRFLKLVWRRPAWRQLYKDALGSSTGMLKHMGYGLYVGRK